MKRFEEIFDENKYQVFLCTCPAVMPFSFATHPWFILNQKGTVSRWEVSMFKRNRALSSGHVNKDLLPMTQGIPILPFLNVPFWKGRIYAFIEGDQNSLAADMAAYIESSLVQYPCKDRYSLLNQNSNTYVQWILDEFPAADMQLPWNAIGKNKRSQ